MKKLRLCLFVFTITICMVFLTGCEDEEKEKNLHNAFKFSKVPVCVDNYEYIYDFSNKVTVCHDKDFNKLVKKLFSNKAYSETFGEKEYY